MTPVVHWQVKAMEVGLEERGAVLCYLDFGGFYDSEGGKVSCWAITFVTGPEPGQSYTVAVFFLVQSRRMRTRATGPHAC